MITRSQNFKQAIESSKKLRSWLALLSDEGDVSAEIKFLVELEESLLELLTEDGAA